jgi:hypothetical protein
MRQDRTGSFGMSAAMRQLWPGASYRPIARRLMYGCQWWWGTELLPAESLCGELMPQGK